MRIGNSTITGCRSGLYKEERGGENFRIRERGGKDAQGIDQFPGEEALEPLTP
ncbi:MAG: hypothetical protein U9R03_03155 [Candidatus Aerophobetes bacterium]|nr:hypothetical protein [Candidatus Aerophobetes bacterium]